jgi:hypothetical protein
LRRARIVAVGLRQTASAVTFSARPLTRSRLPTSAARPRPIEASRHPHQYPLSTARTYVPTRIWPCTACQRRECAHAGGRHDSRHHTPEAGWATTGSNRRRLIDRLSVRYLQRPWSRRPGPEPTACLGRAPPMTVRAADYAFGQFLQESAGTTATAYQP